MSHPVVLLLLVAVLGAVALVGQGMLEDEPTDAPAPIATALWHDPGYYSPVPSTAGEVSPARRRFIDRVDGTCARTYNRGQAAQAAFERRVAGRPDAQERATRFYVRWHTGQYRALRALGRPPQARLAYRRWLGNMGARVRLEARYAPLLRAGRSAEAQAVTEQVGALKARGNALGQRFGLRVCTSNGPGRRPVHR
jgi:hypothetical protein